MMTNEILGMLQEFVNTVVDRPWMSSCGIGITFRKRALLWRRKLLGVPNVFFSIAIVMTQNVLGQTAGVENGKTTLDLRHDRVVDFIHRPKVISSMMFKLFPEVAYPALTYVHIFDPWRPGKKIVTIAATIDTGDREILMTDDRFKVILGKTSYLSRSIFLIRKTLLDTAAKI